MNKNKGFVIIPILFVIIIGIALFIFFQKAKPNTITTTAPKVIENNEFNTKPTLIPQTEINTSDWFTQVDTIMGFSFKIPESWEFVQGYGTDYSSYDIHGPDKDLLVLIGVHTDKRIGKSMTLEDILKEREKQLFSVESYKSTKFEKIVESGQIGYKASGEKLYFNFKNENSWQENDFVKYNFQEKVYVRSDRKVVVIQSLVLPDSPNTEIAKGITDSFRLE